MAKNKDSEYLQKGSGEAGETELQEQTDEAEEKGHLGYTPDPTPDENYTLQTPPDAPTPETDPKLAAETGSGKFRVGEREERLASQRDPKVLEAKRRMVEGDSK